MKGGSVYKVPDGKLLKVAVEAAAGKINSIKISGDFFMHPEEAIEALEKGLEGQTLNEKELEKRAAAIVQANSIQLFGFAPSDLAKAIMMAVQE